MDYITKENKIIIKNLNDFNITHILECGQIFRYKKINETDYIVFSNSECAIIKLKDNFYEIECTNVDYFINFFDLNTNYSEIKEKLSKFNVILPALKSAYGIRILKQNPFEMIISFIISANNNIKRIQAITQNICEKCGTLYNKLGVSFYAFPSLEQLKTLTVQDFKNAGAGYRAKYLYEAVRQLENFDYEKINKLSSQEASKILLTIQGVGPKVCDCILLFGFNKQDCFPVDTWIVKVYNCLFAKEPTTNVQIIRKNLVSTFKNLSGYAQQYLFYYKRSLESLETSK